jgi:NOL1/NOP2/fmu family ribosome biogenesis protein
MSRAKMIVEIDEYRFVKYPNGDTINVQYRYSTDDTDLDCFTRYNIGNDFEKFEESCNEYYEYMMRN